MQAARALLSPRTHWRKHRRVRRTASGRSLPYNLRFPGQYYQAETGLNQNVNRDYDPLVARYVQSDPLGLRAGVNTYSYAVSNPVGVTDPTGLIPNVGELTCIDPLQPVCWLSVAIDLASDIPLAAVGGAAATAGALAASSDTSTAQCASGDPDRCAKAIADAESAYSNLVSKRIPQYTESSTPDVDHYNSILERQQALKDAVRRVKLWCRPLPPQLPEWERVANLPITPRH